MLKPITSLFDLFLKAETNDKYKELILYTGKQYTLAASISFEEAKRLLKESARQSGNCDDIVYYANKNRRYIKVMIQKKKC